MGGIPPEAMEVIADVFLACSRRDSDRPTYSEDQLDRKRRRASGAEEYFAMLTSARCALRDTDIDGIPGDIMAQDERAAWEMYSAGYRASEIARFLGVARPTAVRLLRSAARRFTADESAFRGLSDVYRSEVRRRIYRKPTHCSEQACRRLGYCKYVLNIEDQG